MQAFAGLGGGYAEQAVAPAETLILLPAGLSAADAVTLGSSGAVAYFGLRQAMLHGRQKVEGSNPLSSTIFVFLFDEKTQTIGSGLWPDLRKRSAPYCFVSCRSRPRCHARTPSGRIRSNAFPSYRAHGGDLAACCGHSLRRGCPVCGRWRIACRRG